MSSSGMLRRVALIRVDVSEERIPSETFILTRPIRRRIPEYGFITLTAVKTLNLT
jgi:hypothetical protein